MRVMFFFSLLKKKNGALKKTRGKIVGPNKTWTELKVRQILKA